MTRFLNLPETLGVNMPNLMFAGFDYDLLSKASKLNDEYTQAYLDDQGYDRIQAELSFDEDDDYRFDNDNADARRDQDELDREYEAGEWDSYKL